MGIFVLNVIQISVSYIHVKYHHLARKFGSRFWMLDLGFIDSESIGYGPN